MHAVTGDASLQVSVYQYQARDETLDARLDRLETAAATASRTGTDLLICPELFLSGYNVGNFVKQRGELANGPSARRVKKIARSNGLAIVYGYPEIDGQNLYNAATCIASDGSQIANHRKLRCPNDYERALFITGKDLTFFELKGWRISLLICYDIEFPEAVRQSALAGCALVAAPTALIDKWWFVSRCLVPTRAFENGIFVAYANYAGLEGGARYLEESRIVGADGIDMALAGSGELIITASLEPEAIPMARTRLHYLVDCNGLPTCR